MNSKILFAFLVYYGLISLMFFGIGDLLTTSGYSSNITLNNSGISDTEGLTSGGFMGQGLNLGRFVVFAFFGIGLPSDTPTWFVYAFAVWQTILTLLLISFIISSIWNG